MLRDVELTARLSWCHLKSACTKQLTCWDCKRKVGGMMGLLLVLKLPPAP